MRDVLVEATKLVEGRPLVEDSGDVTLYLNVTDFMKPTKGGSMGFGSASEEILRDAYYEVRRKVVDMVKQELKKPDFQKRVQEAGLMLK